MSALFTNPASITAFKAGNLPRIAGYVGTVSDDYIWGKLIAAEFDAQRQLNVFFAPTVLFPNDPTQAELDALAGAAWAIDPGYDYDQDMIQPGGWSFVPLRQKPVVSVSSIKFSYPSMGTVFTVPSQWIKVDKRAGHVRFIPTSNAFTTPMGGMMIGAMGMQSAPQFVEIRYTAGLQNVTQTYPDLVDLVYRMAMLRMMSDAMPDASGSISADGLSQSKTPPDIDKLQTAIDKQLDTLRQRIHGVMMAVL